MKRPLLLFCVALICGIVTAYIIDSTAFVLFSIVFMISIYIVLKKRYSNIAFLLIGIIVSYSVGAFEFIYFDTSIKLRLNEFYDKKVTVEGFIASAPDIKSTRTYYKFDINKIYSEGNSKYIKAKVLLAIKDSRNEYEYGRKLSLEGYITKPKGVRNPGGFDYQAYLAQSSISAIIYLDKENVTLSEEKKGNALIETGLILREKIVGVIKESLPHQQAALLNGMLIGYRQDLSENVELAFSDAGLSHIMAVSGANVVFIILPLMFLIKILKINKRLGSFFVIGVLVMFVFITGFEASVVRAVIMGITIVVGKIIRRETDIFTSIAFACMLLLLYNPFNLFNIGFQLSFAATISLVLFYNNIKNMIGLKSVPDGLADVLSATLAAQLGVLPVTVYYFNKVSIISLISNLLVVPLTGVITIIGSIMAILGQFSILLSKIIGYANYILLSFVLYITKISSEIPFATMRVTTPGFFEILLYYVAILFFLYFKPEKKIKLKPLYYKAVAGIILFFLLIKAFIPGSLEVSFLDVGQGDSILIKTYTGKTILIDGGEEYNGENVLIPFLMDYGVSKIDVVIASHEHHDHVGGLLTVLADFKVERLAVPRVYSQEGFKELFAIAKNKNIPISYLGKGDVIIPDGKTAMHVLSPDTDTYSNANNTSLVIRLDYMDTNILFTGDAEKPVENMIMDSELYSDIDVLKLAHHGSETSSSEKFLNFFRPEVGIISVGHNRYKHPYQSVLNRLKEKNINVFRTDENGAVILTSDGEKVTITKTIK